MAGDPVPGSERSLEFTSTWAVVTIITCFVVISLIFERLLHCLGEHLIKTKRKAHHASLVKIKDELMLVGFVSLAMTLLQRPVSKICVPSAWYNTFTPCDITKRVNGTAPVAIPAGTLPNCKEGNERAITTTGLHQLHIFIFLLAGVHVIYSFLTMVLALWKVHSWRKWEKEVQQAAIGDQYLECIVNIYSSFVGREIGKFAFTDILPILQIALLTHVRRHSKSITPPGAAAKMHSMCGWFASSLKLTTLLSASQGFTRNHHLRDDYDFDAYMIRCTEDEFQKIVGISLKLWVFVLLFILFNIHGVYLYFWTSFIPIILVLIIGAKLQHVVATLAVENAAVPGAFVGQLMQPRDQLFWFGRPELLLSVLHLVIFQNAFELATLLWHVWAFGFHTSFWSIINYGVYPSSSRMDTNFKPAVLPTRIGNALHIWHKGAKKRLKMGTLFSFAHKKKSNAEGVEQQSLRSQGSENSSFAPPLHPIMEESSMRRDEPRHLQGRGARLQGVDLHSVYIQIDKKGQNERG